jgi:hypothetical protein
MIQEYKYPIWEPNTNTKAEINRAKNRNLNLPILQYWNHGDKNTPLHCMISKVQAIVSRPNLASVNENISFISTEFNHIVQVNTASRDKTKPPSDYFRGTKLENNKKVLIEFMKIIPLAAVEHSYITNQSKQMDIDITTFQRLAEKYEDETIIPWGLRCKENFDEFCKEYDLNLDYEIFMDKLTLKNKENK